MESDIAELADGMWQRALALASQCAKSDHNAAQERLERIRLENDLRAQSFTQREKEYEAAARERERALTDTRDQLIATLGMLDSDRLTLQARDARITDLEAQLEDYRRQLTMIMARVVPRTRTHAALRRPKSRPRLPAKPKVKIPRQAAVLSRATKTRARPKSKH